jgi:hypothetical protein
MSKLLLSAATATILGLASCVPPPPAPPPRFKPNPPYPPEPVDPYGQDVSPPPAPDPDPPAPPAPGEYPTAQRTNQPDQVISPYEPHNVIDVSGFRSGQLARDPSNKKIFRVP